MPAENVKWDNSKFPNGARQSTYKQKGYQKFRWQLLFGEDGWWMRVRRPDGTLEEYDLPFINWELLKKELEEFKELGWTRRRGHVEQLANMFEHLGFCTQTRAIRMWMQHLFLHEERDDVYCTALVEIHSLEPTRAWEIYERNNNANQRN